MRTLEASEFRVAHADLLVEDPVVLLYVAAILAQRLNHANQALIELKAAISSMPQEYDPFVRVIV